jgi:lipid A 3-O-deacylase
MRTAVPRLPPLLAAGLALGAGAASAGEVFVGAYAHDVHVVAISGFEHGAEISAGYRTDPLQGLGVIWHPSVFGFGAVNTAGGVDYTAAGLSWKIGDRFFLRPGIGVAVHDGRVGKFQVGNELNLGSRVLAELELGAGYRFTPSTSIEASLVHLSHGQLAGRQNPGLDDLGLRLTHRF